MRINELTPSLNINTNNMIGVKVLDKELETGDALGQGMVNMLDRMRLENSVNPNVGSNMDMYI